MIISHFARLNSIFWIKGFIKLSEWQRRKERGKREIVGGEKKLRKGILRYLVWLYYELILWVLRKFNYTQDSTCLCVCVCFWEAGTRLCVRTDCSSLSIHRADTRQSSVQNGSQNVGSMWTIKELGGSVFQPPRDLLSPWWVGREN